MDYYSERRILGRIVILDPQTSPQTNYNPRPKRTFLPDLEDLCWSIKDVIEQEAEELITHNLPDYDDEFYEIDMNEMFFGQFCPREFSNPRNAKVHDDIVHLKLKGFQKRTNYTERPPKKDLRRKFNIRERYTKTLSRMEMLPAVQNPPMDFPGPSHDFAEEEISIPEAFDIAMDDLPEEEWPIEALEEEALDENSQHTFMNASSPVLPVFICDCGS